MKNFTWGHGVVVALGSFIAFILFMIFIFPKGKQNSEMITDNYYEAELVYQDIIDAKNNADSLAIHPIYKQNENQIMITFPNDINNSNSTFYVEMYRPDDSTLDFNKEAELDAYNRIVVPGKLLKKGTYILKMKWKKASTNYQIDYNIEW